MMVLAGAPVRTAVALTHLQLQLAEQAWLLLARGLSAIDAASPAEACVEQWVEQWEEPVRGAGDQPAVSTLLERPTTRYVRLATRDSRLATHFLPLTAHLAEPARFVERDRHVVPSRHAGRVEPQRCRVAVRRLVVPTLCRERGPEVEVRLARVVAGPQ